jgi:hypothetical protein
MFWHPPTTSAAAAEAPRSAAASSRPSSPPPAVAGEPSFGGRQIRTLSTAAPVAAAEGSADWRADRGMVPEWGMFWHEVPDFDDDMYNDEDEEEEDEQRPGAATQTKPAISAAIGGSSGSTLTGGPISLGSTQKRSMGTVNLERKPADVGMLKPSDYMSKIAGFGMFA